ncbi:hypothetical protein F5B21DRAFT_185517 [Xylaria acuta]|nr:hypothetical protein F5B21DRAFT_185517 [Xylaria acuta]
MAAQSNTHPVYTGNVLSRQERWQLGRRFGKYDFDQFHPLQGSRHFIGKGKIGEMEVACKFLFRKSHWGVLTPVRNPGGILYLDLVFTEPPGCHLRGATVILTLDENDKDLQRHFSTKNKTPHKVPVHITEHGPQNLVGQLKTMEKLRTRQFIPSLNAGGFVELGGMGQKSKVRNVQESQWRFSSQTMPDRSGRPTTLRWDLSESDLDQQPKHTNTFHTAFAFEHDGQPFFIRVAVSGVLENAASNLLYKTKNKFKKFKFPGVPETATTLVNFGGRDNYYTQPLDELAQKIPSEMVHANMIPVDQVQSLQTLRIQTQESDPPDDLTVQDEETSSDGVPSSQASTKVCEEDETAELKEQALALMAFRRTNAKSTMSHDAYIHDEKFPKTLHTPLRSLGEADELIVDASSQTAVGFENGSQQFEIVPKAPSTAGLRKIRRLLREMGAIQIFVQLIIWLVVLKVGEKYPSRTHETPHHMRPAKR